MVIDPHLQNRRLVLANRIRLAMQREEGRRINVQQMLEHPLYAHSVIKACEALRGNSMLPNLARQFDLATQEAVQQRRWVHLGQLPAFNRNSALPSATWSPAA